MPQDISGILDQMIKNSQNQGGDGDTLMVNRLEDIPDYYLGPGKTFYYKDIPILIKDNCPPGNIYFINSKYTDKKDAPA